MRGDSPLLKMPGGEHGWLIWSDIERGVDAMAPAAYYLDCRRQAARARQQQQVAVIGGSEWKVVSLSTDQKVLRDNDCSPGFISTAVFGLSIGSSSWSKK